MCHSSAMLQQQRLTPAQWAASVKKMQGWGAPFEPGEAELVAAYLAEQYGLSVGPYAIPPVDRAQAEASLAPQPDGDLAGGDAHRGEQIFKSSCAKCHGLDARGDKVGTNLVDRPVLYRAADFASVITKGRNRMPETPGLQRTDLAALLAYLRSLRG
jgi:mono/diheme cytochrome c family protein